MTGYTPVHLQRYLDLFSKDGKTRWQTNIFKSNIRMGFENIITNPTGVESEAC